MVALDTEMHDAKAERPGNYRATGTRAWLWLTFTPEEWEAYERAKMAEQDARGQRS